MLKVKEVSYEALKDRKNNLDKEALEKSNQKIADFAKKLINKINQPNVRSVHIASDYDADGIFAAEILSRVICNFTTLPEENIKVTIGDRFKDGYGVPKSGYEKGELVICLDTGSTERETMQNILNATGFAPFIIDHHEIADNMKGYALMLNFTGQEKAPDYCAAGLCYKIYEAVFHELTKDFTEIQMQEIAASEQFLNTSHTIKAMAGIATIGDMVKVNNPYDDNRRIISQAEEIIGNMDSLSYGLGYFLEETCGIKQSRVTTEDFQFSIVPLINAMGRLESGGGQKVFQALVEDDPAKCMVMFDHMKEVNQERKQTVRDIVDSARFHAFLEKQSKKEGIAIYVDPNIKQGVAGLIASELTSRLNVPAICITKNAKGNYTASGRNAEGYPSLFGLCNVEGYLNFGGHEDALGFSVSPENLEKVVTQIEANYAGIKPKDVVREVLKKEDLRSMTPEKLYALEPFGIDYPKVMVSTQIEVKDHRSLRNNYESFYGRDIASRTLKSSTDGFKYFGKDLGVNNGNKIEVLGTLSLNEFQGSTILQVNVKQKEAYVKQKKFSKKVEKEETAPKEVEHEQEGIEEH